MAFASASGTIEIPLEHGPSLGVGYAEHIEFGFGDDQALGVCGLPSQILVRLHPHLQMRTTARLRLRTSVLLRTDQPVELYMLLL